MLPSKHLKARDVLLQQRGVENKMEKKEPATVSGSKDFDSSSVSDDQLYSTLFQFSQSFLPKYDLQMIYPLHDKTTYKSHIIFVFSFNWPVLDFQKSPSSPPPPLTCSKSKLACVSIVYSRPPFGARGLNVNV